jgi:tetratricopeptide (TPR) repeat protein
VSVTRLGLAVLLVGAACSGRAADHEKLGDRAYVAGAWGDALTEYRLALLQVQTPSARLRAKAGAAAFHVGDLSDAAEEYLALARADGGRAGEAADGLERVALAASQAGDRPALRVALAGVRELASDRMAGGLGAQLAGMAADAGRPADAVAVLPFAAAGASDARQQDSLMYRYAQALTRVGRCQAAVPVYEGVARRQRAPSLMAAAAEGAGGCALRLGRGALDGNRFDEAETWFRRAVSQADDTAVGRAAYVGLGDVMLARGDIRGAAEAYQRALADAAPGDSIGEQARQRLNRIGSAGTAFP